jgi:hypothetical protein
MAWKRLKLPKQLTTLGTSPRSANFDDDAVSFQRQQAPLIEDPMKTRHRRQPAHSPDLRQFDLHQMAAILRFRHWDAAMIREHGPLYYRAMGYSVH